MSDKTIAPVFEVRPLIGTANAARLNSLAFRTPKTAELVARKLRQMIVDGALKKGDHLPYEADLMAHFAVSRPTLREAVRVLEAERLVEVRRGSRSGARVCIPGPEVTARPASLLLELSGATVADAFVAREAIEPVAARILAEYGTEDDFDELERLLDEEIPSAFAAGNFAAAAAQFHLRMVQLSGNATLALIAGMLHEIFERHTTNFARDRAVEDVQAARERYRLFVHSLRRLVKLLRERNGAGALAHWNKHMDVARIITMAGNETTQVRDILD